MLLSVVIPYYHVENYIGDCLEQAAQLEDCEVLLVDDCGSDGSAAVAQAYCTRYPHFRIIRREKNGCPLRATRAFDRRGASMCIFLTATIYRSRRR